MIQGLWLKNFRNFDEATVRFSPKVNIFLGDNGQGKSNLLEAISLLTTGTTFRYADNENFIRNGSAESFLKAKAFQGELEFGLQLTILKSRKNHLMNGKKTTAGELSKRFPCVTFSPESLSAIKEGADQRRQLVDEALVSFDPTKADLVSEFRKALRTRNRILKDCASGDVSHRETLALLESLEPSYIRLAVELTDQRLKALRALREDFNQAMKMISRNENVDISVEYVISNENAIEFSASDIEKSLRKRIAELHDAELSSGASLVGPQKHDIVFLYAGNDSRFYCSQGQQRALILSFKMAQIVYHKRTHESHPMLLLDDVLSELDSQKRDSLIQFLSDTLAEAKGNETAQIFITTTDLNLPSSLKSEDCAVIKVREGQIGS